MTNTDATLILGGPPMTRATGRCLQIGTYEVTEEQARQWVTTYVDEANTTSGYGAYDIYRSTSATAPLDEGDLLTPALLNAPVTIKAFRWLRAHISALNAALAPIPPHADLADDHPGPTLLAPLFAVFDEGQQPGRRERSGVGPTVLAKVLHRKRPGFIPLWDEQVRTCYVTAAGAPVPEDGDRPYAEWIILVGQAIRADLTRNLVVWKELASLAPPSGSPLTPLRALDIVAWRLGGDPSNSACNPPHGK